MNSFDSRRMAEVWRDLMDFIAQELRFDAALISKELHACSA
jgi:hypothetical protein